MSPYNRVDRHRIVPVPPDEVAEARARAVARQEAESRAVPKHEDHWTIRRIAALAGCTIDPVRKAFWSGELRGSKQMIRGATRPAWVTSEAEARAWVERYRVAA